MDSWSENHRKETISKDTRIPSVIDVSKLVNDFSIALVHSKTLKYHAQTNHGP